MAKKTPTADELRRVAEHVEESGAAIVAARSAERPPLVIGDAQNFPRERPADRGTTQGTGVVQESTERAVATLLELAAAMDAGVDVSPVLLAQIQPYVDAYRAAQP